MKSHLFKKQLFLSLLSLMPFALANCTWVKPIENASEVALVNPVHIVQCETLGTTRVSVKDRLGVLKRNNEKVAEELNTLAKNSAVEMGGNTIVELSDVTDGAQEFGIYQCN